MNIIGFLILWVAFCMGAGLTLLFFAGVAKNKARKRSKWLQELQRYDDEEQMRAVSRKRE